MKIFKIFGQLLKPCHNRKAALIGNAAEKHIEIGYGVFKLAGIYSVRHGKLVQVHKHCKISFVLHGKLFLSVYIFSGALILSSPRTFLITAAVSAQRVSLACISGSLSPITRQAE